LSPDSLVIDLGGYQGQWASDIFSMHGCRIFVFEPVPEFAQDIGRRFASNPRISVFPFALGERDGTASLAINANSSSFFKSACGHVVSVRIVEIMSFLRERGLETVDLMKINTEGAEYDLLDHLIDRGAIRSFKNLQIQFHDFVAGADRRRNAIRQELLQTHRVTYDFPFVWENWRRIDA
jgi:FkbM family methyltransferase